MKAGLVQIQQAHGVFACRLLELAERGSLHLELLFVTFFLSEKRLRLNEKPPRLRDSPSVSILQGSGSLSAASTRWAIRARVRGSARATSRATAIWASDSNGRRPPLWPPIRPDTPISRHAWSGSRYALLHSSPLRTVHGSFDPHGS